MIRLRLDRRLSGRRVDSSDDENFRRRIWQRSTSDLTNYARDPATMPLFHLWLRLVAGQGGSPTCTGFTSASVMRDAGSGSVAPPRTRSHKASSVSLAAQLLGKMTSASHAAIRAEHKLIVQEALNGMDPIDREVLALRHFEHLSNDETALVLGLTKSAASNRYIRALKRLKEILSSIPGLREQL